MYVNCDNCLTNLSNSILKHFDVKPLHTTLEKLDEVLEKNNSKNVVLILYDGLGARVIDKVLGKNNFFNDNKLCEIDSVFPATTVAATTTVMSALNPVEHGWIGWDVYLKGIDKTVTLFTNTETESKLPIDNYNSFDYVPYESIMDKVKKNDYQSYYVSPYGDIKYKTMDECNLVVENLCKKEGKKFIYVYNDEPDYSLHVYGEKDDRVINLINDIEKHTIDLCNKLEDTTVIVIADHGHTLVENINFYEYKDLMECLVRIPSIDKRCMTFFVKEDKKDYFEEEFNKLFSEYYTLYKKDEVINKKFFGLGKEHKCFDDALGDFLAVATSNKYFRTQDDDHMFKSHHAGVTEEEIKINVSVIEKE